MPEKERIGKAIARSLKIHGTPLAAVAGGQAGVTGSGSFLVSGLTNAITSVVVTIDQAAALAGLGATVTWNGLTITISVWEPTSSSNDTPIPSTTYVPVNWIATGS